MYDHPDYNMMETLVKYTETFQEETVTDDIAMETDKYKNVSSTYK